MSAFTLLISSILITLLTLVAATDRSPDCFKDTGKLYGTTANTYGAKVINDDKNILSAWSTEEADPGAKSRAFNYTEEMSIHKVFYCEKEDGILDSVMLQLGRPVKDVNGVVYLPLNLTRIGNPEPSFDKCQSWTNDKGGIILKIIIHYDPVIIGLTFVTSMGVTL